MDKLLPGGEIKRDPEIGKTAIQPEPAQTADSSISGSRLISSLCSFGSYWDSKKGEGSNIATVI